MSKVKVFIIIASLLIVIGIVGSILTFPETLANEQTTKEEIVDSEGIKRINVNTSNSKIQVVPTADDSIKVELQSNNSKEEVTTVIEDSTLSIKVKNKHWEFITINIFIKTSSLIIHLPEQQYEALQIKSDNGDISIENMQITDINAKTSNGKINLHGITANSLVVNSNNGRIELSEIEANTTEFKADNGKIILNHIQGDISGKSHNGSITLNTATLDNAIDFHTSNGKINIFTETKPTNVTFDLKTDFGKIRVFEKSDWNTIIGSGEHLIKLRTDNGGITIEQPE